MSNIHIQHPCGLTVKLPSCAMLPDPPEAAVYVPSENRHLPECFAGCSRGQFVIRRGEPVVICPVRPVDPEDLAPTAKVIDGSSRRWLVDGPLPSHPGLR